MKWFKANKGTIDGDNWQGRSRPLLVDWQQTTQPLHEPVTRVAIVGAGISGLMAARTLLDHGIDVTVFEKSRDAG